MVSGVRLAHVTLVLGLAACSGVNGSGADTPTGSGGGEAGTGAITTGSGGETSGSGTGGKTSAGTGGSVDTGASGSTGTGAGGGATGVGTAGSGFTGTGTAGSTSTGAGTAGSSGPATSGFGGGGGSVPTSGPMTGSAGATGRAGATGSAGVLGTAGTTGSAGTAGTQPVKPGLLTAGAWDDNLNFDFYLAYLTRLDASQAPGLPIIPRSNRLEVRVVNAAGAPLGDAKVTVADATGTLLEAPTRSDGRLFFFPQAVGAQTGDALQITATTDGASATSAATVGDDSVSIAIAAAAANPPSALDLALVIDTTGSMQDEIDYLKAEVSDIAARISADFPNVTQRWALILYRDTGDEYVVRTFDFTSSLATFQSRLAAQNAGGGNDYPEAPDQALAALNTLTFSADSVARMAFWIADAPHHDARAAAMVSDFLTAQQKGIHLYPIAASGANDLLEYTMRTAAEVTGGRYLFLTNDSGVGGSHLEPTIPCYFVTTLGRAMVRMAAMELTGTQVEVNASDVIRTAGDPVAGRCTLGGGQVLQAL